MTGSGRFVIGLGYAWAASPLVAALLGMDWRGITLVSVIGAVILFGTMGLMGLGLPVVDPEIARIDELIARMEAICRLVWAAPPGPEAQRLVEEARQCSDEIRRLCAKVGG